MCLLLLTTTIYADKNNGKVSFDWQNAPSPQYKFDLDKSVINQVIDNPNSELTVLFSTVNKLFLRYYHRKGLDYNTMLQHYKDRLSTSGWNVYKKADIFHLFTLRHGEYVDGIFVIVNSGDGVYLINMTVQIKPEMVGELLRHLNQLGIEIPELNRLGRLAISDVISSPQSAKTPGSLPTRSFKSPLKNVPPNDSFPPKKPSSIGSEIRNSTVPPSWKCNGIDLDHFIIQNTQGTERTDMMSILESGTGNLEDILPIMNKGFKNNRFITVKILNENGKNIAIFTVVNSQKSLHTTILMSVTITQFGVSRRVKEQYQSHQKNYIIPTIVTRFRAADVPIHEIRIQGNQKITEERIRQTLNNGSENIEQALKTLFKVMPYFTQIKLQVKEENFRRVATISVTEKHLSSNTYIGLRPPIFVGFNRVTNWEFGTGFQLGKPTDVGPMWMWNVQESLDTYTSNLFGRVSYTFGNPHFHYRLGSRINWGKPYIWNLGLTAQLFRLTSVIAPELFPNEYPAISVIQRVLGYPDIQNYYLNQGVEVGLKWSPILPDHTFKIGIAAGSHESLKKSTDWRMLKWVIKNIESRGNPIITDGRMHNITFQYDYINRTGFLGWYNTFQLEHSNPSIGSDFDFTRVQLHIRYALPLDNNQIRTRLLFGFANASLPIQRQFAISGLGGLRGYPLFVPADDPIGINSDKPMYNDSHYAFMGDCGFLLNVEYHYRLSNLSNLPIFKNAFLVFFVDEGQVWNVSGENFTFNPKADVGIGLQLQEEGNSLRINIAKTLETWKGFQTSFAWYYGF